MSYSVICKLTRSQQMALTSVIGEYMRTGEPQTFIDCSQEPSIETTTGELFTLIMNAPVEAPIKTNTEESKASMMTTGSIIAELRRERERIDTALNILTGTHKPHRTYKKRRGGLRFLTAKQKKNISIKMKASWAGRKRAAHTLKAVA